MAMATGGLLADASSLIVIAPHPDDDVLGCGALIGFAVQRMPVTVAYVTDGGASHIGSPTYPPARLRAVREREAVCGLRRLGVTSAPVFLRWPDGTVPADAAAAAALCDAFRALIPRDEPVAVAVPWRRDPHADHRAVAALAAAVLAERPRAMRIEYAVWLGILGDERDQPREEEGRIVELDSRPWLRAKRAAVREHRSQAGTLIVDAAEAFVLPPALLASAFGPVERFVLPLQAAR